jgi:mRNA-degrading endonuclease toxin of MazEF toxin-antitoxin module
VKNQFQIWDYPFPTKGPHPVVLISHPDICARSKRVNVLFCTSQRQSRTPHGYEVLLDSEDGLNWETFCDCSALYLVESRLLSNRRGPVTLDRRNAIRLKLRDVFRLMATD